MTTTQNEIELLSISKETLVRRMYEVKCDGVRYNLIMSYEGYGGALKGVDLYDGSMARVPYANIRNRIMEFINRQ